MKTKTLILCFITALLLTSCQLALPEKENQASDRLIGVFVTSEYLDLFNMEGYLNDNLNSLAGGEVKVEGNQAEYEGRLYASFDGKDNQNVKFGDIDGIPFFVMESINENNEHFTSTYNDDGMVNSKFKTFYGDDEDKITLDGTIYMIPGKNGQAQYINPVYQTKDNKVYAKSGSGLSTQGVQSQGSVMSQKIEETVTVTENGKSKKKTIIVNLAIEAMLPPQKISIVQMDKDNNALKAHEYMPEKMPENITLDKRTAYVIVKAYKTGFDGKELVEHKLYDKNDTAITTFYKCHTSILTSHYSQLVWQS